MRLLRQNRISRNGLKQEGLLIALTVPIGRSRNRNNSFFERFPLFGKLTSLAFRDLFKMPSQVVVQCFFRLDYDHFNHQILRGSKMSCRDGTAILLVPLIESFPRKTRSNFLRESPLVDELTVSGKNRHSSWVTGGSILVVSQGLDFANQRTFVGCLPQQSTLPGTRLRGR
jgi:hypothetical protein